MWWQPVIVLVVGAVLALVCFVVGAFIMFKATSKPGSGQGFLTDPKGDVFSIPDFSGMEEFPGAEEPNKDEQTVLKNTDRFLKALGGQG